MVLTYKHNEMKFNTILLLCFALLSACSKEKVEDPEFDITTSGQTFKVNEPITFNITGNPDNLTFYSDELGFKYDLIDRKSAMGKPVLKFNSAVQNLTPDNNFQLLISKDFNGENDSVSIASATWAVITSKAVFATASTSTASGDIDLTEFISETVPVTIAFRYRDTPKTISTQRQATWTITNFSLVNQLTDRNFNIIQMSENAWGIRSFGTNSVAKWTNSTTQLVMNGGTTASSPSNDDWIYSKRVLLNTAVADVGISVKNISTNRTRYQYTYATPGRYKVAFAGFTNRYNGQKKSVKFIEITIIP
jgi:hypothetical protein